ncbi:MAG TPA: fibronectin type III-like domain-contianing protein [Solirubrobacteraceae bacterium]|nr:fibronectin type III-like domain-contianing protein [Solirubrobacteraceae bacterium]
MSFAIANTGRRAGSEIAQVYVGLPRQAGEPPKRLVGWVRTELRPGETRRVSVAIDPARLGVWDGGWKLLPGDYDVYVGASSRDIRLRARGLVD